MSNCMNLQFCFSLMLLNQWMTSLVFFNWWYLSWETSLWCSSKEFCLFCRFHFSMGWLGYIMDLIESCLYSLSVWHRPVSPQFFSKRSLNLIFVAMCFAARLIDLCNFGGAFLYVLVIFSPEGFLCCSVHSLY